MNTAHITTLIRDHFGEKCAEETIGLTTSLDDSVEEFVKQFEGENMTDEQLAKEYIDWSDMHVLPDRVAKELAKRDAEIARLQDLLDIATRVRSLDRGMLDEIERLTNIVRATARAEIARLTELSNEETRTTQTNLYR